MSLIILAATIALLSQADKEKFGLSSQSPESAPVLGNIPLELLSSEQLLALQLPTHLTETTSPVTAIPKDLVTSPPDVRDATALNTRVGSEIALFWKNPTTTSRVTIRRQEGNWNPLFSGDVLAQNVTGESFVDSGVTDSVHYSYQISVFASEDANALPSHGVIVNAVSSDTTPPAPPRNITVQSSSDAVLNVQWESSPEDDVVAYEIYRSEVEGQPGALITEVAVGITSLTDTSVFPNVAYYYTVVARDTAGNVSSAQYSAPRMGNPLPFDPPSNL